MSPRYRPMQVRKHSRNQSDPGSALRGPHACPQLRQARSRYRADRYARRTDCRYQCPGGTTPISAGRPGNRYRQSPGAEGSAIDIGYMASGLISMSSRVHAPDPVSAASRVHTPVRYRRMPGSPVPGGVRSRCCTRVPDRPDRQGRDVPSAGSRSRATGGTGTTGGQAAPSPMGPPSIQASQTSSTAAIPHPSKHHEISDGIQPMACRYQHGSRKTQNLA